MSLGTSPNGHCECSRPLQASRAKPSGPWRPPKPQPVDPQRESTRGSRLRELDEMSDLSEQPHQSARETFEDRARGLLAHVVTFQQGSARATPGFSPNVFTHGPITAADVADVQLTLSWQDSNGKQTGIGVAESGGRCRGLIGTGYAELKALALSMAGTRPFKSTASLEFLRDQIFRWAIERARGEGSEGCVDHVLRALNLAAVEHRLLFPVFHLHVESPLVLGSVTLSTFPESIFQEFESRQPEGPSSVSHAEWCRSMRRDFQGSAVAETCVFGEPTKAREIASERVELAIGVLRFFAPSHVVAGVTSSIARWGSAPRGTDRVFATDASGRFVNTTAQVVGEPAPLVLSDSTRDMLLESGLAEVRNILAREPGARTDLEGMLLRAMVTFGRAALGLDLGDRMVWYCAGLESILVGDAASGSIVQQLSERLALFAYDTLEARLAARNDVKAGYSLRSRFVHHGQGIESDEVVMRFARHGVRLFCRIAQSADRFGSKARLLEHIDRMKFLGGSQ